MQVIISVLLLLKKRADYISTERRKRQTKKTKQYGYGYKLAECIPEAAAD